MSNTSRVHQAALRRENALWDHIRSAVRVANLNRVAIVIYETPYGALEMTSNRRWQQKLKYWRHNYTHANAPRRRHHKLLCLIEPGESPEAVRKRIWGDTPTSLQAETRPQADHKRITSLTSPTTRTRSET